MRSHTLGLAAAFIVALAVFGAPASRKGGPRVPIDQWGTTKRAPPGLAAEF